MNPFDILEIKPGATADEIKAAYHRLAKQWHPDRFEGSEKAGAEERFRLISEAFELLKDPFRRQQAEQQAGVPQAPKVEPAKPSPVERTPDDWIEEARKELEQGNLERAFGLAQYAIRLDGQKAAYHLFMAKMLEQMGRDRRAIIRTYETAFQLNPKDADTALKLAELFQATGMQARAQGMIQAAQKVAPNHKYFKQAARAAEAAQGAVQDAAPGGVMDQVKSLWNRLARKG